MTTDLTHEELTQAVRAARIHSPGFSEEQYRSLMELERRLVDTDWLEAVQELARLMEERGVACSQALDEYRSLLKQNESLKKSIASLQDKSQTLQAEVSQHAGELSRLQAAIRQGKEDLSRVTAERQRQERELASCGMAADKKRAAIDKDLERCRKQAEVTKQEVADAGELKKLLASQGFSFDLALALCREFGNGQDAVADLQKAIEEHGNLARAKADLAERGAAEKQSLEAETEGLGKQRDELQASLDRLNGARAEQESRLLQIRADLTEQDRLSRFYRRYHGLHVLLEIMAGWENVFFLRCNNPTNGIIRLLDPRADTRVWTDRPAARCPHCGLNVLVFDERVYRELGTAPGPAKLELEE